MKMPVPFETNIERKSSMLSLCMAGGKRNPCCCKTLPAKEKRFGRLVMIQLLHVRCPL